MVLNDRMEIICSTRRDNQPFPIIYPEGRNNSIRRRIMARIDKRGVSRQAPAHVLRHRRSTDCESQPGELRLDAALAPKRILPGHAPVHRGRVICSPPSASAQRSSA